MSAEVSDAARRIANIVRVGKIAEVDYAKVRVRVTFGGNKTAWIPWMTGRAGSTKDWNPPSVGEQVAVLSPSGNLGAGFILNGAINYNGNAAPGSDGDTTTTIFGDGTTISQNKATKALAVAVPSGGTLTLSVGTSAITITDSSITIKTASLVLDAGSISANNAGGAASMNLHGDITHTGNTSQTGSQAVSGDVVAGAISLKTHHHTGVQTGGGNTGGPA